MGDPCEEFGGYALILRDSGVCIECFIKDYAKKVDALTKTNALEGTL